jgi:hypothetical protein
MGMARFSCLVAVGVWAAFVPQAAEAAVSIQIDLSAQSMHVVASSGETYDWPISSARSGYSTPRGYYRAQRLERMHFSHKYHMSPMPHSIFFRGGYAIHGTISVAELGSPASHGCIRLAPDNAAMLYSMVAMEGARISIAGSPPVARSYYARTFDHEARRHRSRAFAYAPFRSRGLFFNLRSWLRDPSGNGR